MKTVCGGPEVYNISYYSIVLHSCNIWIIVVQLVQSFICYFSHLYRILFISQKSLCSLYITQILYAWAAFSCMNYVFTHWRFIIAFG